MKRNYRKISILQKGSYGTLWRGLNTDTNEVIAIKECKTSTTSKREISILSRFSHPNIIKLIDSYSDTKNSIMIYEFIGTDLFEYQSLHRPLSISIIKFIMHSILTGLSFLHEQGFMHRDLTATNILINEKKHLVKICDFGLSKSLSKGPHTPKMCTLQYSAPEVLIGSTIYNSKVDIWSCGVLFLELILGYIPFNADSDLQLLRQQLELLGTPDHQQWPELPQNIQLGSFKSKLNQLLPAHFDSKGIDFIKKLLVFSPSLRISAKESLGHPFFADISS